MSTRIPQLSGVSWKSERALLFTASGKHDTGFDDDFPLRLEFWEFRSQLALTPNYHDYYEVGFVFAGGAALEAGGNSYRLHTGDVYVIGSNEYHSFRVTSRVAARLAPIFFLPDFIYRPGVLSTG